MEAEEEEKEKGSANDSEALDATEIYTNWKRLEKGSKLRRLVL